MMDGLLWWTRLAGLPPHVRTLVYGGDEAFTRNHASVRPWFAI
jgi:hypothetical protein